MFFKKKDSSSDTLPSAPKKSHFCLMGLSGEDLNTPIHIHYDSFKSAFEVAPNTVLHPGKAFDFMGTFLVTILSPSFSLKGHTCRVSGINHKLSRRGVVDGVIAHVEMVRDIDDGPLQRVHVALREDGSVVAMKETSGGYNEADLNEVYFSYGDTVFLDGSGVPFDEMNKPQPTPRQKAFMREEKDKQISNILDR